MLVLIFYPAVFEGSLGKLSVSTVYHPRQIVDVQSKETDDEDNVSLFQLLLTISVNLICDEHINNSTKDLFSKIIQNRYLIPAR